jgi:hypothetical protein
MEVSDQLANLGAMIAGGIEKNVQQTQFNNALPAMQQVFQQSMDDFDNGRSGSGFARIMSVAAQYPNNPLVQNMTKLAFTAGKEAGDSYSYRLKAQQPTSIADLYLAKQLGLTPNTTTQQQGTQVRPATPAGVGAGSTNDIVTIKDVNSDQNPAATVLLPGEESTDDYEFKSGTSLAETGTKVREGGVQAGLASQNFVTDFNAADFNKEKLPEGAKKYIGAGVDTILVPKDLTKLKQSGATLKGSIGNISFDAVDTDPTQIGQQRLKYKQELSKAISALDKSQDVQDLIKFYGGFNKIPANKSGTKGELIWNITDENGKPKPIKLKQGTENNPQTGDYFEAIVDTANQANLIGTPLFMSGEAEVPAPLSAGGSQINPKTIAALKQAQEQNPNASKDQIISIAKEIAKGL